MSDVIYIISARRGDYSDRTEYAVCWYATKETAENVARVMEQKSNEWRSRTADSDEPWNLNEKAAADIGDPQWSYYDETRYCACELPRGPRTKKAPQ